MDENQLSQETVLLPAEPEQNSDNSVGTKTAAENSGVKEGKSADSSELILGKFKTTEDLTKAYQQLEKLQGNQSSELGALREKVSGYNNIQEACNRIYNLVNGKNVLSEASQKYGEYFKDPSFRELAAEAYKVLGDDFDADRLVNLVEGYVSSRILAYEKSKKAEAETKNAIGEIKFDKNEKNVKTNVKKSIQQMSPTELDALLDELI